MPRQFDLHRLRLLRELKIRGTISAVAAALSYSHSSVSQQLKILEAEVGVTLHEPDGRRVRLTPQAEILVEHVEAILTRLDQADADLARAAGILTGTFRIATFQTVMLALMPAVMASLRAVHPQLNIELVQADPNPALSRLQLGDFDLVFDELFAGQTLRHITAVDKTVLHRDTMRLALPQTTSSGEGAKRLQDLADADWVMEPVGSPAREWADRMCVAAGFTPTVRFESPDMIVHEQLVRGGHAVAFLPDLLWATLPPTVHLHDLPDHGYRDIICSIRAGTAGHPAVTAATGALRDASATTAESVRARLDERTGTA